MSGLDECTEPDCPIDYVHQHRVPGNRHTEMVAAEMTLRATPGPLPVCGFCVRNDGDDVIVVHGACTICRTNL